MVVAKAFSVLKSRTNLFPEGMAHRFQTRLKLWICTQLARVIWIARQYHSHPVKPSRWIYNSILEISITRSGWDRFAIADGCVFNLSCPVFHWISHSLGCFTLPLHIFDKSKKLVRAMIGGGLLARAHVGVTEEGQECWTLPVAIVWFQSSSSRSTVIAVY